MPASPEPRNPPKLPAGTVWVLVEFVSGGSHHLLDPVTHAVYTHDERVQPVGRLQTAGDVSRAHSIDFQTPRRTLAGLIRRLGRLLDTGQAHSGDPPSLEPSSESVYGAFQPPDLQFFCGLISFLLLHRAHTDLIQQPGTKSWFGCSCPPNQVVWVSLQRKPWELWPSWRAALCNFSQSSWSEQSKQWLLRQQTAAMARTWVQKSCL